MKNLVQLLEDNTMKLSLTPGHWQHAGKPSSLETRRLVDGKPQITYAEDQSSFTMTYRLLSQAVLHQHTWYGLIVSDYTQGTVLQDSIALAAGKTIISDHWMGATNWIGRVLETSWSTSHNGENVPGMDGLCQFATVMDKETERDSDRAWMLKGIREGYLQGMSMSLWMKWHKSHPDMELGDFLHRMGDDINGETVRFIIDEIKRYYEASVCIAGVDQTASPRKEGEALATEDPIDNGVALATLSASGGWTFYRARPQVVVNKEFERMAEKVIESATPLIDYDKFAQDIEAKLAAKIAEKYEPQIAKLQADLQAAHDESLKKDEALKTTQAALQAEQEHRDQLLLIQEEKDLTSLQASLQVPESLLTLGVGDKRVSFASFVMSLKEGWQKDYAKTWLSEFAKKMQVPTQVLGAAKDPDPDPKPETTSQAFAKFMAEKGFQPHQRAEAVRAFYKANPKLAEQEGLNP